MRCLQLVVLVSVALMSLTGCASLTIEARGGKTVATPAPEPPRDEPKTTHGRVAPKYLGIPPGHLPAPGECRVWRPGTPPGHQSRPGPCARVERDVRPGDWLVYRPSKEREIVRVSMYDARTVDAHPWVVVYDFDSGRLLGAR